MIYLLSLSLLTVAAFAGAQTGQGFYCDMKALTPEERTELPKILDHLIAAKPEVKELANGYELSFKSSKGLYGLATQWTSAENRCCPFFDFALTVHRYGGPMTIRITGPAGVKEFIADDLPRVHQLTGKSAKS